MYCRKCGKQIPDNSRFCSFCGEDLSSDINTEHEERGKKRKVVFDGEIHKCPNCGEILDAFVTKCPTCGFEIRGTKGGANKVEELAEKLQKANNTSKNKELISNFYVPNTKEDIIEFFTLAVSPKLMMIMNARKRGVQNLIKPWLKPNYLLGILKNIDI